MADGNLDDFKGRAKQAAGDLTNDESLKREGKIDRATGTVKQKIGEVAEKAKEVVGKD